MTYGSNSGCLIITNSNLEIESYNYLSMKVFTNNDLQGQKEKLEVPGQPDKKSLMERNWKCNIGEHARQIRYHFNKYL